MSEFIIPIKVSLGDLDHTNVKLIEGIHPMLVDKAMDVLDHCDSSKQYVIDRINSEFKRDGQTVFNNHILLTKVSLDREISNFERENLEDKTRYAKDIDNIYRSLMKVVANSFSSDDKLLTYEIKGQDMKYKYCHIAYWREANPGMYAAVDIMIDELKLKGWSPNIKISPARDSLILTCDFTD